MNRVKQVLFIKAILAEKALNRSLLTQGESYETHLCRQNYEDLLDLIEKSEWYEEYRSFKIMAVLYFADKDKIDRKRLSSAV